MHRANKPFQFLVLCAISALFQAVHATNLIENGDFETGTLDPWYAQGSATVEVSDEEDAFEGEHYGYIGGRTVTWEGIAQDILDHVTDGETYKVSAAVKLVNFMSATIKIMIATGHNDGTYSYYTIVQQTIGNDEWVEIEGEFSLNESTDDIVSMKLYFEGPSAGIDFIIDNVVMEQQDAPTSAPTSEPTSEPTSAPTPAPTYAPTPNQPEVSNLIANGGFETGNKQSWQTFGGSVVNFSVSTTFARPGSSFGARVFNRLHNSDQGIEQNLTNRGLVAGTTYSVRVWAKLQGPGTEPLVVRLRQVDDDGVVFKTIADGSITRNKWTEIQGSFTFTVSGSLQRVSILVGGPAPSRSFLIDDISVEYVCIC